MIGNERKYLGLFLYLLFIYEIAVGHYQHGNPQLGGVISLRQFIVICMLLVNYDLVYRIKYLLTLNTAVKMIVIYYVYTVVSIYFNTDIAKMQRIGETLTNFLLLLISMNMFYAYPEKLLKKLMLGIAAIYTLVGYLYVQLYMPESFRAIDIVITGTAHQVAGQLLLYSTITYMVVSRNSRSVSLPYISIATTIMLLMTGARTAIAVGLIISVRLVKRRLLFFGSIVAALVLTASIFSFERTIQRWERLIEAYEYGDIYTATEVQFRANNTELSWELFAENPVFGIGIGNWETRVLNRHMGLVFVRYSPHSSLDMLVHQGLLGVVLFYGALLYAIFRHKPTHPMLGDWGLYSIVAALLMTIGGAPLTKPTLVPMISAALFCCGGKNENK